MAEVKTRPGPFEAKLKRILQEGLSKAGIAAYVITEKIRGTKLHRVTVISYGFSRLRHSERQDLAWRIVSQHFDPDQQLRISMIVTLDHAEGKELLQSDFWSRVRKALNKKPKGSRSDGS